MIRNQDIDRTFQQLGMSRPPSAMDGGITSGIQGGTMGGLSGFSIPQQPPPALAQQAQETPQAVKSGGQDNFWAQFGKGVISPVTDTLSGFGVTKPREMPSSIGGIIGNMLGSVVGWTALTVATAGVGSKVGLVGAGAAKIAGASTAAGKGIATATGGKMAASGVIKGGLISQTTGTTIAKGAAWGGLSQAHTWAFGQQEYENIPKEMLIGALTGGAFGAVAGKVTSHMAKTGKLSASPRTKVAEFMGKYMRDPNDMMTLDDASSMVQGVRHARSGPARIVKDIINRTEFDDTARSSVKNLTTSLRNQAKELNLQKSHLDTLDMLDGATTKVQLDRGLKRLKGQISRMGVEAPKGVQPHDMSFNQLFNLASTGKVNPYGSVADELSAVAQGSKRFVLTHRGQSVPEGMVSKMIPKGSKYGENLKVIARTSDEADKFVKQVGNLNPAKRDFHTKLGRMLDYKDDDIAAFLLTLPDAAPPTTQSRDMVTRATKLNDLLQQAEKEVDGFITRALDPEAGVRLASLRAIQHGPTMKQQLEQTKDFASNIRNWMNKKLSKGQYKLEEHFYYGDEAEELLNRVMRETGVRLEPDPTKFRDPGFLVGKAAKYQDEWTDVMSRIKAGDVQIMPGGSVSFGATSPIKDGDILKYLQELKGLPKDVQYGGVSLHDHLILESSVGWLSTKLAPLRSIMGEQHFRSVRRASIDHHRYMDSQIKQLNELGAKFGWKSHKARQEHGVAVGRLIERKFSEDAPMNRRYTDGSWDIVAGLEQKTPDDEIATSLAKRFGLKHSEAKDVLKGYNKTIKHHHLTLEELAEKSRLKRPDGSLKTLNDFKADIAADYIHNAVLKKAKHMKQGGIEQLAKQMDTTPEYLKAASDGRVMFDKLFEASGMDPHMYRAAYLPHFRQFEGGGYKAALKAFKDVGVKQDKINKIFWANELNRQGDLVTYDENFFNAASRYITGMSKQKFFQPAFDNIDQSMKHANIHSSRVQVYEQLKRTIQGVPGEMEQSFDNAFHNFAMFLGRDADTHTTKTIGAMLAELQYSSGMGFNPFMPIRNLTQKALGLSSITESGNPIEGLYWMGKFKMAKMSNTDEAKKWIRLNDILTHRTYAEGLDLQSQGFAKMARSMGMSDASVSRMDDTFMQKAMRMFRWSDRSNVEDVFGAKAMYAASRGFSTADSVEMARAATMASQFMYGIDSPMLYKNPLGKQIGIFQSWPLNWSQMLWEQGTQGNMRRAASTVATMAVASELLSMTGISFRSIHPTETVQGLLPMKMLEGERNWPLAFRSTVSVLDYMRSLANGEEDSVDTAINNFIRSAEGLVPYGAVTNRTLRFLDRMRHDWRDYADTGFMHTNTIAPETRENTSRLVRMLGETPQEGKKEALMGLFGTTTKSIQRMEDAEWVRNMEASYRRTRRLAIQSFIDGDYDQFQKKQEQLVVNFGQWIEPKDIKQELQYMAMTARERQTRSLPQDLEDIFYENIADPRSESMLPY